MSDAPKSSAIAAEPGKPGRRTPRDRGKHLVVAAFLLIELLPLYVMFVISLKDNRTFVANPWLPDLPSAWHWENWAYGLKLIGPYIVNTLIVAGGGTVVSVFLGILGAYFFARYRLPGARLLWGAFLVLMLLPSVINLVPLFLLLKEINLLNTLAALILVGVAGSQTFNIVVLRNFIEELPRDLFEAAEIDGAGHWRQVTHIVIPLSGSIIGTLAMLTFLGKWNEYLLPYVVLRDPSLYTLGVGLIFLDAEYVKQWGPMMASFLIASAPLLIVFAFSMRLFVRGLSAGAVKG